METKKEKVEAQKQNKIVTESVWDKKYLRESVFMPFGSMCNLIGQTYQGRELKGKKFENLTRKAFSLAIEFTQQAFKRGGNNEEVGKENELPNISLEK